MIKIKAMTCEYRQNPVGIDNRAPRFAFLPEAEGRGSASTAYQVIVASDREFKNIFFDSGKVESSGIDNIVYCGSELVSRGEYFFKGRLWNQNGKESAFSDVYSFEMGLLSPDDWHGCFITLTGGLAGTAGLFRNTFDLDTNKKIKKARLYIAAIGFFEPYINGKKVGDAFLDAAFADIRFKNYYRTFDVTSYVTGGKNCLGAEIAQGWYKHPSLLAELVIEYDDGEVVFIHTKNHGSWKIARSPVISSSVYDGEIYDAREEKENWSSPNYRMKIEGLVYEWMTPNFIADPDEKLVSQQIEEIKITDEITPVKIRGIGKSRYVVDFGRNFAGVARLSGINAKAGDEIKLRFAEILYDDGSVNQENLRTALARDIYIAKGTDNESYNARFTYHGFRYCQIEGLKTRPAIDQITGLVLRNAVEPRSSFTSSNKRLNQILKLVKDTELNNMHSFPSDCPQRDERQGWLNDVTSRGEGSVFYNFVHNFYSKWIADITDTQDKNGGIGDTAPYMFGSRPGDPCCSCYLLIPMLMYNHYGEKKTIEDNYEGFKKWQQCLTDNSKDNIVQFSHYGDWASPKEYCEINKNGTVTARSKETPGTFVSSCFYALNAELLAAMAEILGIKKEVKFYNSQRRAIINSINKEFFNEETFNFAVGNQACNTLALYVGVCPKKYRAKVVANLISDIHSKNDHFSTGNQCTKLVIEELSKAGQPDLAFKMIASDEYPSFGYMLKMGATSVWERWEYITSGGMNSHNHAMYGSIGAWYFNSISGISPKDRLTRSMDRFVLAPKIPKSVKEFKSSVDCVRGNIGIEYAKQQKGYNITISVPFGSTAFVSVPFSGISLSESGKTVFENGAIKTADGISDVVKKGRLLNFTLSSGAYNFEIR